MKEYKTRANDPRRAAMTLAARTARRVALMLLMAVMALAAQTAQAQPQEITGDYDNLTLTESDVYHVMGNVTITGDLIIQGCNVTIDFDYDGSAIRSSLTVGGKVIIQADGNPGSLEFHGRVLVFNDFDDFNESPKEVGSIIEDPHYVIDEVSELSGKTFTCIWDSRLVKTTDENIEVNDRTADFKWNDGGDDYYCFVAEGNDDVELAWNGDLWVQAFMKSGDARFTVKDGSGEAVSVTYDYEADPIANDFLSGGHYGDASFTMPVNDDVTVSARACVPVTYVDGNGVTQVCRDNTALPPNKSGGFYGPSDKGSGWYVSNGATVDGGELHFDSYSDVHLILCDGTTTSISNDGSSSLSCGNLTIYGQSGGTGALTLSSNYYAINVSGGHDLTIYGGHVSATSTANHAIFFFGGDLIVKGGTLTACASDGSSDAICLFGTLQLSGGTVEATTGAIYAENGASIASGLQYTDGTNAYTTSITSDNLKALGAVTLTPMPSVTLDGTGDTGISGDLTALDGKMAKMALTRTFPAGKKQTVCLPFAPTELLNHGKVWQFTGISEEGGVKKAVMTEVTSGPLSANTPYIFQASSEVTSIDFGSVAISIGSDPKTEDATAGFTFHGTYEKKIWEADDDAVKNGTIYGFMMKDNEGQTVGQFVKARRRTVLRPFSCYLEYAGDLSDIQTSAARGTTRGEAQEALPDVIEIVWQSAAAPGAATGISEMSPLNTDMSDGDAWFDLSGRRLSGKPKAKGIYIHNGKTIIVNR